MFGKCKPRSQGLFPSQGKGPGNEVGKMSNPPPYAPPRKTEERNLCSQGTVEPRFNEVAGDRPNLFVKWRVRYIENLDITNLRGNDQNVRYIEVIVND